MSLNFQVWNVIQKRMHSFRELEKMAKQGDINFYALVAGRYEFLIPIEYSALNDKNDKKIFEGSVFKSKITVNRDFHGDYAIYEVLKIKGQWITSYIRSEKGSILPRGHIKGFLIDEFEFDNELFLWSEDYKPHTDIEIIGNIYENPDLLEVSE